jgi:hypothetical protein
MTQQSGRNGVEKLISSLSDEKDPQRRAATLLQLVESAGSRLWPIIEAMIESTEIAERVAAIVAAEKTRHLALEDRIARELASDHARLASAAAHAICVFGDLRDQELVSDMLSSLEADT